MVYWSFKSGLHYFRSKQRSRQLSRRLLNGITSKEITSTLYVPSMPPGWGMGWARVPYHVRLSVLLMRPRSFRHGGGCVDCWPQAAVIYNLCKFKQFWPGTSGLAGVGSRVKVRNILRTSIFAPCTNSLLSAVYLYLVIKQYIMNTINLEQIVLTAYSTSVLCLASELRVRPGQTSWKDLSEVA